MGQPRVVVNGGSLLDASLRQKLLDQDERFAAERDEHSDIKRLAREMPAAKFCSRCGRRWKRRYYSWRAVWSWALTMGAIGGVIGAVLERASIVH